MEQYLNKSDSTKVEKEELESLFGPEDSEVASKANGDAGGRGKKECARSWQRNQSTLGSSLPIDCKKNFEVIGGQRSLESKHQRIEGTSSVSKRAMR